MHQFPSSIAIEGEAQSTVIALFVSDVHIDPSRPRTSLAFLQFLEQYASHCPRLYLLGDLFEYWAGDDDLAAPEYQPIVAALSRVASLGVEIFWIAGNRDFLIGQTFAAQCHMQLLAETEVLQIGEGSTAQRILLAHGDAQCTDDTAYMQFRAMVRETTWQQQFLSKPLAERKAIIAAMRQGSKMEQANKAAAIMDVHPLAIEQLMRDHACHSMIHGHTHRPACHTWQQDGASYQRHVLPDWDCDIVDSAHALPRGGWISLHTDGQIRHVTIAALSQSVGAHA